MIRILRDGTTTFVMTLTELTTITNPEYLFEFVEEQTQESYFCILSDTSTSKTRFNEFTIVDGTDINFPIDGFYTYKVYEQEVSGNLDPTGKSMVETGRVHVYIVDAADNDYSSTITDNIYE